MAASFYEIIEEMEILYIVYRPLWRSLSIRKGRVKLEKYEFTMYCCALIEKKEERMLKRDLLSAAKFLGLALVVGLLLALLCSTCEVKPASASSRPGAVAWLLMRDEIPTSDERWLTAKNMERILTGAALDHDIDPALFVAMAYKESSFEPSARGEIGEIGLVQVHGKAARGCELDTPEGQAVCGARWLVRVTEECGDRMVNDREKCLKTGSMASCGGGLSAYASGSCSATESVARIVRVRLKLAEKIRPFMLYEDSTYASGGY